MGLFKALFSGTTKENKTKVGGLDLSNNKNLTKEIQEQREIEKIQIEEQKLLAHKEKYKKMITLLELSDNEIKKSICDSNYLSKLQNDLIDFEFAINVLGYNKDETLEELRTTTGSNKDRPILEVRRIFSWAWDIYRMTTDDCLVIFNDSNQRNRFIDEYYAFCDAYQADLQINIVASLNQIYKFQQLQIIPVIIILIFSQMKNLLV